MAKHSDSFEFWLSEKGFTDSSISRIIKEEFSEPMELATLDRHDIESLTLKLAQRKLLEKVIASLTESSSSSPRAEPVLTKDVAGNQELNQFLENIGQSSLKDILKPASQEDPSIRAADPVYADLWTYSIRKALKDHAAGDLKEDGSPMATTASRRAPASASVPASASSTCESVIWTRAMVHFLLAEVEEWKADFQSPVVKKKTVWEKICINMHEAGYFNVTGTIVEKKFRNMKATYKKTKENNESTGRKHSSWEYFDKMETLLNDDPALRSVFVTSSQSKLLPVPSASYSAPEPASGSNGTAYVRRLHQPQTTMSRKRSRVQAGFSDVLREMRQQRLKDMADMRKMHDEHLQAMKASDDARNEKIDELLNIMQRVAGNM